MLNDRYCDEVININNNEMHCDFYYVTNATNRLNQIDNLQFRESITIFDIDKTFVEKQN